MNCEWVGRQKTEVRQPVIERSRSGGEEIKN